MEKADTLELVKCAVSALDDKKGCDVKVIDISEVTVIADYFVIAGGNNRNHIKTLCDNVEEKLIKEYGRSPKNVEGYTNASWILMDYEDIIIHIFSEEDRLFYDIERLWRDGKDLNIKELND